MCGLTKIGQDYMLDEWLKHYYFIIIILYDIVHMGKFYKYYMEIEHNRLRKANVKFYAMCRKGTNIIEYQCYH